MGFKTKAISYLRVSGKGQVEGDGFPRQRLAIERYARANNIELLQEFRDEGVSGKTELEGRDGLAAALARVESNGVKMVLVEKADRLARDSIVAELIIRKFQKVSVTVIAAESGTDLTAGTDDNHTAKMIRQILAVVAENERCDVVRKLRAARDRASLRRGKRVEGRKCYGTRPGEQDILQRILRLRRAVKGKQRMPFATIADRLNADKVPTRTGRPWQPATVFKIIRANAKQLTAAL